jgi:hypothetical protein
LVTHCDAVSSSGSDQKRIKKLAITVNDAPTIDCCLHVHGQVWQFDKPFKFTATPRSADEVDWAPVHRYFRTSIALNFDEYDRGVTDRMKEVSNCVLQRRASS